MTDIRPSIVIYLNPDDSIAAESYRNGSRVKLPLFNGFELDTIRQELAAQRREIESRLATAAAEREAQSAARSRRVFADMSKRHGLGFAKQHMSVPTGLNAAVRRADKADQSPISLDAALSL